ncbi:O-antigen polymerase [Vibrio harveyi]|uniref:O-antigen polymerase n=1 Tax=Vibrio harveyi TaxID=669 RepID=UPI001559F443|nr:O-antigen polymerase [Vibrio harveyi]
MFEYSNAIFLLLVILFSLFVFVEQKIRGYGFSINFLILLFGFLYSIGPLLSDENIPNAIYLSLSLAFSIFACVLSSMLTSELILKENRREIAYFRINDKVKYGVLFFSILSLFLFVYVVIIKIGVIEFFLTSRSMRTSYTRSFSHLMLFRDLACAVAAFSLLCYCVNKKSFYKKTWLFLCSLMVIYSILTISRAQLVAAIFPSLFILSYFGYIKTYLVNLVIGVGIFIALIWKWLLSTLIFSESFSFDKFSISVPSELYQWAIITNDVKNEPLLLGTSFLDAFISFIHPFYDTVPLSIWYVNKFEPIVAQAGGGRGFSLFSESILNFGFIGVPVVFALLGVFLGILSYLSRKYVFAIYITAVTMPYLYKIFRSEFLSITKTWWWFYVIPILFVIFFSKVVIVRDKHVKKNKI